MGFAAARTRCRCGDEDEGLSGLGGPVPPNWLLFHPTSFERVERRVHMHAPEQRPGCPGVSGFHPGPSTSGGGGSES